MQTKPKLLTTKNMIILALIAAIAFILAAVARFPVLPGPVPLRFDPKDVVIVIGGFLFGPLAAFIVTVIVSFTQMITVSMTGPWGFLMNVLSSTAFCCTAAFIYGRKRTLWGAVIGLAAGTVAMTVVMLSWNYIILPMYMPFVTREFVWNYLFTFFLPFNLFGGIVNTSLTLLLYKPITSGLRMTRMLPPVPKSGKKAKVFSPGVIAASLFVLITCVLWAMAQQGVFDRTPDVDYNYMSAPYESNYED